MPNTSYYSNLTLDDLLESYDPIEDPEDLYKLNTSGIDSKFENQTQQYYELLLEEKSKSARNIIESQQQQVTQNYLGERHIELLLRILISATFIWIIISQLKKTNGIIQSIGNGSLKYDVAVISIYITGVFGQLIALAIIIFNNLFPSDNNKNQVDLIKSILSGSDNKTDN